MAHKVLDGVTAVGTSNAIKAGERTTHHQVYVQFKDYGVTAVSAMVVKVQGGIDNAKANTGIISNPNIAIGSTAENVANDAFHYRIGGTNYTKGAVAAGTALPANYAVTTAKYGAFKVFINSSGTITYGFPAATQAYATVAAAMSALDDITEDASGIDVEGLCEIGSVLLYNNTGAQWDSNTDDLTDGSDITNAVFISESLPFIDLATYTLDATDLANYTAAFEVVDKAYKYVRVYISTLTGDGSVDAWYTAGGHDV